jgi:S-DNA-T family DNA segregation ATPase FtsK/SpoIIIE
MALKKKKSVKEKNGKSSSNKNYFTFTSNNKKQILGLFLIIISIILFLSIVTYDSRDKANLSNSIFTDFFKQLGNLFSSEKEKIDVYNLFSLMGAHISFYFVWITFGYFSITIPIVTFLWGISIFKKIDFKFKVHVTNFLLLCTIIFATFFGVLHESFGLFLSTYELSGFIGDHLGNFLRGLIGGIGSILVLGFAFVTLLIFALDIDIKNILLFLKNVFSISEETEEEDKKTDTTVDPKEKESLDKIKKLSSEKKKKKEKLTAEELSAAELMEKEAEEQTRIRIIRKDDVPVPVAENEVLNEEVKKVNIQKTGELPEKKEKNETEDELKLPNQWEENIEYKMPGVDLLDPAPEENYQVAEEELTRNAELLKEKLKLFDIEIKDISVTPGPVVTLYEIVPAPGVKISKIVGLENDIALALSARGIRIIAPIPGKGAIGVEIPNAVASLVNARAVIGRINESDAELPLALGKTISGDVYVADLAKMPHLLVAGSTGSGKSVGINMIVSSLLYTKHPSEVKFVMVDPKKIELSFYNKLRKHYLAVSPDLDEEIITSPQNAILALKSAEYEMERRYDKLAKAGVRNIVDYNKKVKDPKTRPHDTDKIKHHPIPYIIVIVDELADLMITAGKEVEEPITRLAQLARAVGIHLVLATQRPSVNVITGVIKANFSSRIAYQVATKIDSRTILDMNGAEQLLGRGDMLFLPTGSPKPIRIQNAFISTDEVEKITNYVYSQQAYSKPYFLPSLYEKKKESSSGVSSDLDPMFEDAAKVIVRHQQGSVSLLQRRLKLGYSRAARIVDQLEEAGIVGPNDGSKARSVLVENEEQLETILRNL